MTRIVRSALLALWIGTAAALGQAEPPRLRAALPAAGLAFGAAFELEVERSPAAVAAGDFDERTLQPLVVELLAQRATADGGELRRYRARCFRTGAVQVGGLALELRSSLPEPAGPLEWPGPLRSLPTRTGWVPWLVVGAVAGLGLVAWRRRRSSPERAAVPAPVANTVDVAAALAALPPPDDLDAVEFQRRLKALLRTHCAQRFGLLADTATSEELRRAVGDPATLQQALLVADSVLFGAQRPAAAVQALAQAAALAFVRATAAPVAEGAR